MSPPTPSVGANLVIVITIGIPHYANTVNNKALTSDNATGLACTNGVITDRTAWFWRFSTAVGQIPFVPSIGGFLDGSRVSRIGFG